MLTPTLEKLQGEADGKFKVVKVDIDSEKEITENYNVSAVPTLVVIKGGKEVNRGVGAMSIDKLKALIGV
jgi:thioredoxin 1